MVCDFRALISPHIQICRSTVGIMSLRFNSDGTFRVLQMADIQDGPDVREDTIRLIEAAIRKAHPDLIVLTGDQIRGYDPAYIDTFLRRRGEQPGTHVRAVTEIEAKIRGITDQIATLRRTVDDRRHRHRFAETVEKRRSQRFCQQAGIVGGSHQSRHRGVAARRDTAESARHVRRVFGAGVGIAYPLRCDVRQP